MTRISDALVALELSPSLEKTLHSFSRLFQKWNRSINLSAARSDLEIEDHLIDSLHVVPHLRTVATRSCSLSPSAQVLDDGAVDGAVGGAPPSTPVHLLDIGAGGGASPSTPAHVLDVGAGGGLPAVVVAICLPDTHITALEPIHKKHAFLRAAARELSLTNLDPFAERLEGHHRHDYDAAMSRATFDLRDWLLTGAAHVRPGGLVLGFEAVPRSDLPPGTLRHPYQLDGKARAIVIRQITDT